MSSVRRKITGEQGSWFAAVRGYQEEGIPDGTRLPCVHDKFFVRRDGKAIHDEPWDAPYSNWSESRLNEYLEGIKGGFVIVTQNEWPTDIDPENNPRGETGRRKGYVGVFEVSDARIENGRLRFQYLRNLESAR